MRRYLLRKRRRSELLAAWPLAGGTSLAARRSQLQEIERVRLLEAPFDDAAAWFDARGIPVGAIAAVPGQPSPWHIRRMTSAPGRGAALHALPLSGMCIVELPEDAAAAFRDEMGDYDLLDDQPLSVPSPPDAGEPPAHDEAPWRWTQELIGAARTARVTGRGVTVAVLDTGVDARHRELDGRVIQQVSFDLRNSYAVEDPDLRDTHGHGTRVAGVLAGVDVGVAPSALIRSAVILPGGHGALSGFIFGLEWAAGMLDVTIMNLSAGIDAFSASLLEPLENLVRAGVLPVLAIGNDGPNRTSSPGNLGVGLAVGACDRQRRVADFSGGGDMHHEGRNYTLPHLVAPGVDVYSCIPDRAYGVLSGTSMAAPIVSGVAALLLESYTNATVYDIMEAVLATCEDLGAPKSRQGAGLVRFDAAARRLAHDLPPSPRE